MLRLLLDCGIFPCIDHRKGVFYQLSGRFFLNVNVHELCSFIRIAAVRAGTVEHRTRSACAGTEEQTRTETK